MLRVGGDDEVGDADDVLLLFRFGGMEISGRPRFCRTSLYVGVRADRGGLIPILSSSEEEDKRVVFKGCKPVCDEDDNDEDEDANEVDVVVAVVADTGGRGGNANVACLAVAGSEPRDEELGEEDDRDLEDDGVEWELDVEEELILEACGDVDEGSM